MTKAIGNARVHNEGSYIRRNVASERTEIAKTRMNDSGVAPEFETLNRTNRRGEFDAFARDFAGDDGFRGAYRDKHIALDDVVKRDGPFRFVIPEQLFGPVS